MTDEAPMSDNERLEELAANYVVGSISSEEQEQFESLLESADPKVRETLAAYSGVAELMLDEIPAVVPDPSIRESLLERIKSDSASVTDRQEEPFIVRSASTGPWNETGIPGVSRRVLFEDHEQNRITVLMRLDAGSNFPAHKHSQAEECLVLEGDLDFGDYALEAGDYLRLAAGTEHGVASTKNGCICLVTTALVA